MSGVFIVRNDKLYAIDSESNATRHPGWTTGVRIGTTKEDKVIAFIPPHPNSEPRGRRRRRCGRPRGQRLCGGRTDLPAAAGGGLTKYVKR